MSPPNIRNAVKAFRQILRDAADPAVASVQGTPLKASRQKSRNAAKAFRAEIKERR